MMSDSPHKPSGTKCTAHIGIISLRETKTAEFPNLYRLFGLEMKDENITPLFTTKWDLLRIKAVSSNNRLS
jgi:hypothetical protein